jgi:hypothetical protein
MKCFNCGLNTDIQKFGIAICTLCEAELRLFTDDTILRQNKEYKSSDKYASYPDEIADRLQLLEKDFLKKKIKLSHILERIDTIKLTKS